MRYLHDNMVQHRDLKAQNCLVVREEGQYRVKITDFGLSKSKTVVTQTNERSVGTETHMAPELFSNIAQKSNEDREKSDVYSYGIVMYEVLSRKIPFEDVVSISAAVIASRSIRFFLASIRILSFCASTFVILCGAVIV